MKGAEEEVDDKLKRLATETAPIAASAHFTHRVKARLALTPPPGIWSELSSSAKWLMPVFALAAVLAVVWAASSQSLSTELMASTETAELEW